MIRKNKKQETVETITGCIINFRSERLKAQTNSDVIDYVNTYKEIAIREMQRTGVPAAITLRRAYTRAWPAKATWCKNRIIISGSNAAPNGKAKGYTR